MSLRAMMWAFDQKTGSPVTKLILLKLADNANEAGVCWPSLNTIARHSEVDRSTVIRHIKNLVDMGLVRIIHRYQEGVALSNHYHLIFEGSGTVPPGDAEDEQGSGTVPLPVVAKKDHGGGRVPPKPVIEPVIQPQPQQLQLSTGGCSGLSFSKHIPVEFHERLEAKLRERAEAQEILDELAAGMEKKKIGTPELWIEGVLRKGLSRTVEGMAKTKQRLEQA